MVSLPPFLRLSNPHARWDRLRHRTFAFSDQIRLLKPFSFRELTEELYARN
jgi:hypothetical protein